MASLILGFWFFWTLTGFLSLIISNLKPFHFRILNVCISFLRRCQRLLQIWSVRMSETHSVLIRQGWTSQPDGRGTWDILWSCGSTMILCSWSLLCLNVPGPTDSKFQILRRKVYVTTLCFLGPEFIFIIALGQWKSSCQSVRDFHGSGFEKCTMRHAHFADMGGFILHTETGNRFLLMPNNSITW